MPKSTPIEGKIPKLYRRSSLNQMMFGFVKGVRATLHTLSVTDAIDMFMECFGLDEDDYNRNTALTAFNRMNKEFLDL